LKYDEAHKSYQDYKETDLVEPEESEVEAEQSHEIDQPEPLEASQVSELKYNYSGEDSSDNVIWLKDRNIVIFTSRNNIILHDLSSNTQTALEYGHENTVSCLAMSTDQRYLASCSADADSQGTAPIIMWDATNDFRKIYELRSHEVGIKSILFSNDSQYLISLGSDEERSLVLWDVEEGLAVKSTICPVRYNGITLLDPQDSRLMFATVGREHYRLWKIENDNELLFYDAELPEQDMNLTAISTTTKLGAPYDSTLVLMGTEEGDIVVHNPENGTYLAKVNAVMRGAITLIETRPNCLVLADSLGNLIRHNIIEGQSLFTEPGVLLNIDGAISGISFDEELNEGHIGTNNNTISFVNWEQGTFVRVLPLEEQ
jgi:hypothetical protein